MQKSLLKKSVYLFILLSCTHLHAGITLKRNIYTTRNHRKKRNKELLTCLKGSIIFTALLAIDSKGLGLIVWGKKQTDSVQSNQTDSEPPQSNIVLPEVNDIDTEIRAKAIEGEDLEPRTSENEINSAQESTIDHSQTDTQAPQIPITLPLQPKHTNHSHTEFQDTEIQWHVIPQSDTQISDEVRQALANLYINTSKEIKNSITVKKIPLHRKVSIEPKFFTDNDIFYHNHGKSLFKYNIPSDTVSKTQMVKGNIDAMIFAISPEDYNNNKRFQYLISGFSRFSGSYEYYPKDLERLISRFYSKNIIVLKEYCGHTKIFDPKLNKVIGKQKFEKNSSSIYHMCTSPDGTLLATVDYHKKIYIYELLTGKYLYRRQANSMMIALSFHSDGKSLVIGKSITIEDFIGQDNKNPVQEWNFSNQEISHENQQQEEETENREENSKEESITTLFDTVSSCLNYIEFYDQDKFCITTEYTKIRIWNVKEKQLKATLHVYGDIFSTKIHPNEKFLAATGYFGIKIWHLATQKLVFHCNLKNKGLEKLDFSPNGDSILIVRKPYSFGEKELLIYSNINRVLDEWVYKNT